ncbi:hypothetical protein GJAV_G00009510 [Gymnothorax javanicus]|nr:hypothetical protein GJAV_G00009510 [Gymnothorax javanicus]
MAFGTKLFFFGLFVSPLGPYSCFEPDSSSLGPSSCLEPGFSCLGPIPLFKDQDFLGWVQVLLNWDQFVLQGSPCLG